jgi:adenylyltransferase/sulfurtransferase
MTSLSSPTAAQRLARARVLIVGVGGLGRRRPWRSPRPASASWGSSTPTSSRFSNLHRQPLYRDADLGRAKVDVAAERLRAITPGIRVTTWRERFPGRRRGAALPRFDAVLDGTDTIASEVRRQRRRGRRGACRWCTPVSRASAPRS